MKAVQGHDSLLVFAGEELVFYCGRFLDVALSGLALAYYYRGLGHFDFEVGF